MNTKEFVENTVSRTLSKYDERFSTVAESGSYDDLSNKPTIPEAYDDTALAARVTAVEDGKASLQVAAIPGGGGGEEINAIVSQGENSVSVNYYKDGELPNALNLNVDSDHFTIPTTAYVDQKAAETQSYAQTYTDLKLTQKQNTLVSGQNIKTINGQPVIGSGNLILHQGVGDGLDLNNMPSYNELQQMLDNNALLYIDGNWLVTGLTLESSDAQVIGEYADKVRRYFFNTNEDTDAPLTYEGTYADGYSMKPNMLVNASGTSPYGQFQTGDGQKVTIWGRAQGIGIDFVDQLGRTERKNYDILANYEVCIRDEVGTGNVVQIGTIKEGDDQQNLYQFFYRTDALANATVKTHPFVNLLADYTINDFIDATGMTSNGIFIGNGRTDNDNRLVVQQFSKNNKNIQIRAYKDFSGETALIKVIFKGKKNS